MRRKVIQILPCIAAVGLGAPSKLLAQTAEELMRLEQRKAFEALILKTTGGMPPKLAGVSFEIAPLIDNGNVVPIEVTVDSPMTETDYIEGIWIINERNPLPEVAEFKLSPAMGAAWIGTRIRLATSQHLMALAKTNKGEWLGHRVDVLVTLAACLED